MKCPSCGATELIHDTRGQPYINKGEQTVISPVTGDHCPASGEVVLDREQGDRYSELVGAFQRQVNAFSRYENGKTKPPLALVKLLKVLDRHPELLKEVRAS